MFYVTTPTQKMVKVDNWNDCPEPILKAYFQLNNKECIVMEGFDSYIRTFEKVKGVNVKFETISKIILFGKFGHLVSRIDIDLQNGSIAKLITKEELAYNNKPLNPVFWKLGVKSKPKIYKEEF